MRQSPQSSPHQKETRPETRHQWLCLLLASIHKESRPTERPTDQNSDLQSRVLATKNWKGAITETDTEWRIRGVVGENRSLNGEWWLGPINKTRIELQVTSWITDIPTVLLVVDGKIGTLGKLPLWSWAYGKGHTEHTRMPLASD